VDAINHAKGIAKELAKAKNATEAPAVPKLVAAVVRSVPPKPALTVLAPRNMGPDAWKPVACRNRWSS